MNIAWKLSSSRTRMAAAATASAVVVAGALVAFAPDPGVAFADGYGEGDGLNRYVVTLATAAQDATATAAPQQPAPAESASAVADLSGTAWTGERGRIDIEMLGQAQAALGPGGRIVAFGSDPYYVTDTAAMAIGEGADGSVVDAATVAPQDAGAAVPAQLDPVGEDAALAALASRPAVDSAQRLDDGRVLVATHLSEAEVAAFDEVGDVEPSVQMPVLGDNPTDPYWSTYGWNLRNTGSNAYQQTAVAGADVDAPAAWASTQGQGVVVAVIDTGFDSDHPDLAGSLWTNPTEACGASDTNGNGKVGDCHGWNFYANNADVDNGTYGSHGTSVSGALGARVGNGQGSAGVAPAVTLMPLVIGGGETVDLNLAVQAIRYAADNGADVINASFGGPLSGTALTNLSSAVDYAISKGVVVVAAAGNDAGNRDSSKIYPANLANPALITVASTTAADTLAATSAYGATSVDLAAPGDKVFTTWNDGAYRLVSGTSIAAPHVAAAAALHLSLKDLTPAEVRAALLADADPLSALSGKTVSGGRLTVGPLATFGASTQYAFSGMVAPVGAQSPVVEVTSSAPGGNYQVVLGLAMLVEGEVWAVSGEDITLGGVRATTDDTGTATFSLGALASLGTRSLTPSLSLGEGTFGLTVQVLRDGEPLTRPYAAPLLVSPTANPGTGGSTDPGTGGSTDPGTGGSTDPGTGGSTDPGTGGSTNPGTGGSTNPGTGGTTDPGTGGSTDPGTGGSTNPGTGGTTDPGTGGSTNPGTGGTTNPGTGGSTDPGTGGSTNPGTGGTTDPGTGGSTDPGTGGSPNPGTGTPDVKNFSAVGAFAITQINPVHVPASGGTLVTIRGNALESGLSVRVGATAVAHVVSSTSQQLTFLTPARADGTYDVTVYKSGRSSVLQDALVYQPDAPDPGTGGSTDPGTGGSTDPGTGGSTDPGTGGSTDPGTGGSTDPGTGGSTDPGTGGSTDPGTGGSTDPGTGGSTNPGTGGTTDPGTGGSTNPGTGGTTDPGTGGSTDPGTGGTGGGDASTPGTPNATRNGPNGERLVRNDALAPLSSLWTLQCTTRCPGIQM